MTGLMRAVANGASGTVRVIGQVTAWLGLALVLMVAFNVLARYVFSYGTVGLQEAEWHLMALAALFGMSYGINQGGEVRVDVVYARMSPRRQALVNVVSAALLVAVALIIAWLSVAYVKSSLAINEGSPDPGGLSHRYLLKAAIPAGFVLLAIQAVAGFCHSLLDLLGHPNRTPSR